MHQSSFVSMQRFKELVMSSFAKWPVRLLDVGSCGINGTYREIFAEKEKFDYIGLDVAQGPNVDYVPADPYSWPEIADESIDVIISGQAFEHIEYPWMIMQEMERVLKPGGIICIIAPSRGPEHKFPVDCWRYYPDGFRDLANWTGLETIEARTFWGATGFTDGSDQWGDTVCILSKGLGKRQPGTMAKRRPRTHISGNALNPLRSAKQSSYYGFSRPEVIEAIAAHSLPTARILEIGCANGSTGALIKKNLPVEYYVGVDISEDAAIKAAAVLDKAFAANVEADDLTALGIEKVSFDVIIALDVLEHLRDPWDTLARLTEYLKQGGHVVASIPNVQNISVVADLVNGKWEYADAGILDATHLRFFTRESISRMFSGAGLSIKQIESILNPKIEMHQIKASGNAISMGNLQISNLTRKQMIDFFTYQFMITAEKRAVSKVTEKEDGKSASADKMLHGEVPVVERSIRTGMTSIIILTFNELKYTKECIESIRKHTPEQHQIILIDNGSTDGTVKWLRQIAADNKNYKVIENSENLGFAKGCNQGISEANGEYILLLNNDVVVTEGWLNGLLECLSSSADTGIVGPMTNSISGPQKVADIGYKSIEGLDSFAKSFRERFRHRHIFMRRIVGFCMLFKHELAGRIGYLDETFGTGNFEDDDYCLRAALAGFRNMVAGDVFIHHYGSKSFIGNRINYASAMSGNRKLFDEKWSGIDTAGELGKKLLSIKALDMADQFHQKGEIDKAVNVILEGIGLAKDDRRLYYTLAEILLDSKRYKDAYDAITQMPGNATDIRALTLAGYCMDGLELPTEAGELADRILDENSYAPAMNLKGVIEYKRGEKDMALEWFRKTIECDPSYGEPYTNLGVTLWSEGNRSEGLDFLERGFLLSPKMNDIADLYYSAISQAEAFDRAEAMLRHTTMLYPLNRQIAFLLIDCLIRQGKDLKAMSEIEQAMLTFGIDDGILAAALAVREKVGAKEIDRSVKRPSISLCMIVKNEEEFLPKSLFAAENLVDEMIIVDTGSADRTKDIAKAFGAKVYEMDWRDDFSEARNMSLSKASGDWILVLDADEVIASRDFAELGALVGKKKSGFAYAFTTRNYVTRANVEGWTRNDGVYSEEAGMGWLPSCKVRLFQNESRTRFENPVHELVEPSLKRVGTKMLDSRIPIHHYGKLNDEKSLAKGERYYLLGKQKLEEKGDDRMSLLELALQAAELKRYDEAVDLWHRLLKIEPNFAKAYFNLGFAYLKLGKFNEGIKASLKALEVDPSLKEATLNLASCELYGGSTDKAAAALEGMLEKHPGHPSATALLGAIYFAAGRSEEGSSMFKIIRKMNGDCIGVILHHAGELESAGRVELAVRLLQTAAEAGYANSELLLKLDKFKDASYRKA